MTRPPTLTEFLLARFAEDEAAAIPKTMIISGGAPAPVVPNCIGPGGHGCPEHWSLGDVGVVTAEHEAQMREHSLTHATRQQRRVLAECEAKRRIVEEHRGREVASLDPATRGQMFTVCRRCCDPMSGRQVVAPCPTLRLLALPYADHPDFRQEWKP